MSDAVPGITVGLVGTGRMGSAMAHAIARAGLPLVVNNRSPERAQALADELGARVVASPADVAAAADVTLTMLADDAAVASVYGGPDGLLEGARRGTVLVDLSTVTPEALRAFESAARDAGVGLLDAPVSGSTATAESGQLTLMVGGAAADLERARPALEPLAKAIFHLGPLGTGAAMKLAVNTVIFGLNGALSEGLVLAELAGIDREAAYDVLAASAVGAPYVGYKRAAFVDPDGRRSRSRSTSPQGPGADHRPRRLPRHAGAAGRREPRADAGGIGGRPRSNDFSTVAVELRARARPAVAAGELGAPTGRVDALTTDHRADAAGVPATRPRHPWSPVVGAGASTAMAARILIKDAIVLAQDPYPRRAAAGGRARRRRRDRRRRADPVRGRRAGHRRHGDIVIPGFIDTHRHTWETSIRTCARTSP